MICSWGDAQKGSPPHLPRTHGFMLSRSNADVAIALEIVRERTNAEGQREVRQSERSATTNGPPIDGSGDDHAYRSQAEASAAIRPNAQWIRACQDPSRLT